jgi:hypothetical protein
MINKKQARLPFCQKEWGPGFGGRGIGALVLFKNIN